MAKKFIEDHVVGSRTIIARGREVVQIEADALHLLARSLDDNFEAACRTIFHTRHRLIVTGMGKSGHIARKIAATFSATGTPALYLHPGEAAHGDLGMIVKGDTLIVISNSGNTPELRPVLNYARVVGIPIIGITSREGSLVMDCADIHLRLPVAREACAANVAPTTSTTLQLAMGDALAMATMDMRGVSSDSLRSLHPGGMIGLRLTPVADIMHQGDRLPLVEAEASMPEAILAMTSGGFGIAGVTDSEGGLIGVITDGDLRRHFAELSEGRAGDIMTHNPKTIPSDMLAQDALMLLNTSTITAAFIIDRNDGRRPAPPVGIVHIHDFLRVGLS